MRKKSKYVAQVYRNDGNWHSGEYNHKPLVYLEAENLKEAKEILEDLKKKEHDIYDVSWIKSLSQLKKEFLNSIRNMKSSGNDVRHLAKAFVELEKNEEGEYTSFIFKSVYGSSAFSTANNKNDKPNKFTEANLYYDF